MSLFKAKEWWSSTTVVSEDVAELYNIHSLKISQLGVEGSGDNIIIGNVQGLLQIFKPHDSYQPTHVILEYMMNEPILQVDVGKLVFGSDSLYITVLHPKMLSIFSLLTKEGQADIGDQNVLSEQYHHILLKTAFNMIVGAFGGIKDKDFICVQSLDGVLMFFEQDVATFSCSLPNSLLPGSITYSHCTDSFVTCTANWMIESYSYHNLSQTAESESAGKKVTPDWTYNVGEDIKYIQKIQTSNNSCSLIMLGDRSLYCLNDNGTLGFMKRFDFDTICAHAYLIGWYYDPSSRLMEMIVSETSTLLIYERTTLLWSCQLTFMPISICRGFFSFLPGTIVALVDSGEVKCLYLGTEPELFTAPPLTETDIDFDKAQEELETIQNAINNQYDVGEINLINKAAERELPFQVNISQNLEISDVKIDQENEDNDSKYYKCSVKVTMKPLNRNDIKSLQVSYVVQSPLVCSNLNENIFLIMDEIHTHTDVYIGSALPITSLKMIVVLLYINSLGNVRILKKEVNLPMKLICRPVRPSKDSKYKLTLTVDKPTVELMELFKDYDMATFTDIGASNSAIAFENINLCDFPVTIISAKSSQRYRLQSDGFVLMNIILFELVERLNANFKKKHTHNIEEGKPVDIQLYGSIPNDLIQYFIQSIERHINLRQNLFDAEKSLDILQSQFILIQKRLMIKYREKPPSSCDGVIFLLKDTHQKIDWTSNEITKLQHNVLKCGVEVSCCINLIYTLLDLVDSVNQDFQMIKSALQPHILHHEQQDWEESASLSILHLLKNIFSKSDKDRDKLVPLNHGGTIKEFESKKFVKYIHLLIERALTKFINVGGTNEDIPEQTGDQAVHLNTVNEEEDNKNNEDKMLEVPQGSLFGYNRKPILTARWEKQQHQEELEPQQ